MNCLNRKDRELSKNSEQLEYSMKCRLSYQQRYNCTIVKLTKYADEIGKNKAKITKLNAKSKLLGTQKEVENLLTRIWTGQRILH